MLSFRTIKAKLEYKSEISTSSLSNIIPYKLEPCLWNEDVPVLVWNDSDENDFQIVWLVRFFVEGLWQCILSWGNYKQANFKSFHLNLIENHNL